MKFYHNVVFESIYYGSIELLSSSSLSYLGKSLLIKTLLKGDFSKLQFMKAYSAKYIGSLQL